MEQWAKIELRRFNEYAKLALNWNDRVLDYMMDIYKNVIGNADSRTHNFGEKARQIVENAREQAQKGKCSFGPF